MKHPRTNPAKTARFVYPTTPPPPYRIRFVRHRRDLGFQHCPQYQLQHFPVASGGRGQQTTSSSSDRHPGQQQIRFAAKATRTREKIKREEHERRSRKKTQRETIKRRDHKKEGTAKRVSKTREAAKGCVVAEECRRYYVPFANSTGRDGTESTVDGGCRGHVEQCPKRNIVVVLVVVVVRSS